MKTLPKNMQDMFRVTREEYLESARVAARNLLKNRMTITIEDVHQVLKRPEYLHYNVTGSVFQHPDFVAVGYETSKRPHMHGAVIRKWTLSEDAQPHNDIDSDY